MPGGVGGTAAKAASYPIKFLILKYPEHQRCDLKFNHFISFQNYPIYLFSFPYLSIINEKR